MDNLATINGQCPTGDSYGVAVRHRLMFIGLVSVFALPFIVL